MSEHGPFRNHSTSQIDRTVGNLEMMREIGSNSHPGKRLYFFKVPIENGDVQ
jgi:hypothetical protein